MVSVAWERGMLLPGTGADKVLYNIKDHLGSVRTVVDGTGAVRQRFDYYPYGTVSRSWSSSSTDSPDKRYRFGGKEVTGYMMGSLIPPTIPYLDFGARLYSPYTATWMSADPQAENYYPFGHYVYCAGDPVNVVDPDGQDWYRNNDNGYYTWFYGSDDHEGYTYYGGRGSILGEMEDIIDSFMVNTLKIESLFSEGFTFDLASIEKNVFTGNNERGFWEDFISNSGPEFSILTQDHPMTQELMTSVYAKRRDEALQRYPSIGRIKGAENWSIADVPTTLSLTRQFVGSYSYRGIISKGGHYVYNMIYDAKSRHSLFYHLANSTRRSDCVKMGNTYQFYVWVSPIQ